MKRYRVQEIKLALGERESVIPEKIAKKYRKAKLKVSDINDIVVVRKSFDARGDEVKKVYTLDFSCDKNLDLPVAPEFNYDIPFLSASKIEDGRRPIIIGFGPCGMFCALVLARAGLKPIVLERGQDVDTRIQKVEEFWKTGKLDPECNVQFGEGGAGTFSDGKLNSGIKDKRARFVLETFAEAGADKGILIDARPHIGTDALRKIVKNIREEIISLGGEIRFGTSLESLLVEDGEIRGVNAGEILPTNNLVLAIGHSARDTFRNLRDFGIFMEPKAFSMGVRVQHSQSLIDEAMYGKSAGHPELPPAYYKLATKAGDGRGVYSFCMCPGGEIVNASSQEGGVVTNGMSNQKRDSGFANSGILVDVRPEDYAYMGMPEDPLAGVYYQEKYEKMAFENGGGTYNIPTTTWGEYKASQEVKGEENSSKDSPNPVAASLPDFVARDIYEAMPVFGRKIKGFDNGDTIMKAIESRSSSPVRILRSKETLEGYLGSRDDGQPRVIKGFYPAGEGAGYAGGITSAACDGMKIAEKIIEKYMEKGE